MKLLDDDIKTMLEIGCILREMGRIEKAEKVFAGIAELIPDSEVPLILLATVYTLKKDFEQAIKFINRAIDKNPDSVFAKLQYGEILLFQNKTNLGAGILRDIVHDHQNSPYSEQAKQLLNLFKLS